MRGSRGAITCIVVHDMWVGGLRQMMMYITPHRVDGVDGTQCRHRKRAPAAHPLVGRPHHLLAASVQYNGAAARNAHRLRTCGTPAPPHGRLLVPVLGGPAAQAPHAAALQPARWADGARPPAHSLLTCGTRAPPRPPPRARPRAARETTAMAQTCRAAATTAPAGPARFGRARSRSLGGRRARPARRGGPGSLGRGRATRQHTCAPPRGLGTEPGCAAKSVTSLTGVHMRCRPPPFSAGAPLQHALPGGAPQRPARPKRLTLAP